MSPSYFGDIIRDALAESPKDYIPPALLSDVQECNRADPTNHYYEALAQLRCPSTLEGKTTLAIHYAQDGVFQLQRPHEDAG